MAKHLWGSQRYNVPELNTDSKLVSLFRREMAEELVLRRCCSPMNRSTAGVIPRSKTLQICAYVSRIRNAKFGIEWRNLVFEGFR